MSPAATALTSSTKCLEVTGCHWSPTLRSKATLSGNSAALPNIASVRLASSGTRKFAGTAYSAVLDPATQLSFVPRGVVATVTNRPRDRKDRRGRLGVQDPPRPAET